MTTWTATAEQSARAQQFEDFLHAYLQAHDPESEQDRGPTAGEPEGELRRFVDALRQQFAERSEQCLADYWLFPLQATRVPNTRASANRMSVTANQADKLVTAALMQLAGEYTCDLAFARIQHQLRYPLDANECAEPAWYARERQDILDRYTGYDQRNYLNALADSLQRYHWPYLEPLAGTLVELICARTQSVALLKRLQSLVEHSESTWLERSSKAPPQVKYFEINERQTSSQFYHLPARGQDIALGFARLNALDRERHAQLVALEAPDTYLLFASLGSEPTLPEFREVAQDLVFDYCRLPIQKALPILRNLAEGMNSDGAPILAGARFVLAGIELLTAMGKLPEPLRLGPSSEDIPNARVLHLICNVKVLNAQEAADLLASLRKISPAKLQQLLRYCNAQRELVMTALGWEPAIGLYNWMIEREDADPNQLFDSQVARELLQQAAEHAAPFLAWVKSFKQLPVSLRRIEAVQGVPDKKLEGMLSRLSQEHIRLYGLYPIKDRADLSTRVEYFNQAGKLARKQFGQQRSANVKDAAAAGLANLAITAGFGDLEELEWSLDANAPSQQDWAWQGDDYVVALRLPQYQPELAISKSGKPLKSMPAELKKNPSLAPLLAQHEALKSQAKRYRIAFENRMASGRALSPEQLLELQRLPMARNLLRHLFVRQADGQIGLLDQQFAHFHALTTAGLSETRTAIEQPMQIAHALHLLQAGLLIAAQQHVVGQKLQQPFKQAFRECYLLTPAEREASDHSRRFAGRRVRTAVLGAILGARGWRIRGSDFDFVARKRIGGSLVASLALPEVYQFLTQEEATTLDVVTFAQGDARLALAHVPELAFSEVMRDLDLIITAGAADSDQQSAEVTQTRTALITALLPGLGLKNVRIEGHHAFIRGKRAEYRLHLGTAVIHIVPAGYLCIIPAQKQKASGIALPFVDEDERASEVLSKLLLLSADDKIKDADILSQIDRRHALADAS